MTRLIKTLSKQMCKQNKKKETISFNLYCRLMSQLVDRFEFLSKLKWWFPSSEEWINNAFESIKILPCTFPKFLQHLRHHFTPKSVALLQIDRQIDRWIENKQTTVYLCRRICATLLDREILFDIQMLVYVGVAKDVN